MEKCCLLLAAAPAQSKVAPRIAPKPINLRKMAAGNIGGGSVRELLQQRDGLGHHADVFAVQKRHQPELPPRSLRFRCDPSSLQRFQAQLQSLRISGEGLSLAPPDLTCELIQQQHQSQTAAGPTAPVVQFSGEGAPNSLPESLSHQGIEAVVAAKPLPGTTLLEPELQNVFGAQDEQL